MVRPGTPVGVRVLLVDDELLTRTVVGAQLEALGHVVRAAEDGASALRMAQEETPEVVLLDMELPDSSGLEVLDELQGDAELSRVPVVFLTGRTGAADVAEALRRGAHDYLRKPADEVELAARVGAAARLQRLQAELHRVALTDELTGLPNRRAAQVLMQQAVSASARYELAVTVIVVDVDRFKRVNDTYGHPAGDAVLQEVARRLSDTLRVEDLCARWGGEEFLVVVLGVPGPAARVVGERLRHAVSDAPVRLPDGQDLTVTVSAGLAQGVSSGAAALVRLADDALYRAKETRAGPGRRPRGARPAPARPARRLTRPPPPVGSSRQRSGAGACRAAATRSACRRTSAAAAPASGGPSPAPHTASSRAQRLLRAVAPMAPEPPFSAWASRAAADQSPASRASASRPARGTASPRNAAPTSASTSRPRPAPSARSWATTTGSRAAPSWSAPSGACGDACRGSAGGGGADGGGTGGGGAAAAEEGLPPATSGRSGRRRRSTPRRSSTRTGLLT